MNELTIMLAVAQFGITIRTFALGATRNPPSTRGWPRFSARWARRSGSPTRPPSSSPLLFVTFLHLVIGEMAPKSWAIAHPELAATIIALPARASRYAAAPARLGQQRRQQARGRKRIHTRGIAGARRAGHRYDPALVEHSAAAGELDDAYRDQLTHVFELQRMSVGACRPAGRVP